MERVGARSERGHGEAVFRYMQPDPGQSAMDGEDYCEQAGEHPDSVDNIH